MCVIGCALAGVWVMAVTGQGIITTVGLQDAAMTIGRWMTVWVALVAIVISGIFVQVPYPRVIGTVTGLLLIITSHYLVSDRLGGNLCDLTKVYGLLITIFAASGLLSPTKALPKGSYSKKVEIIEI